MPDLISFLEMELYLCCLVKQHKCKRGVNCFHISFREQMRREMHFTGTRTGGGCLAWCNVEHLFLFPQGCWVISEHGYCGGRRSRGWGCENRRKVNLGSFLPLRTTSYRLLKSSSDLTALLATHSLLQWLFPQVTQSSWLSTQNCYSFPSILCYKDRKGYCSRIHQLLS